MVKNMDVAFGSEKRSQCGNALILHFICRPPDGDSCDCNYRSLWDQSILSEHL